MYCAASVIRAVAGEGAVGDVEYAAGAFENTTAICPHRRTTVACNGAIRYVNCGSGIIMNASATTCCISGNVARNRAVCQRESGITVESDACAGGAGAICNRDTDER